MVRVSTASVLLSNSSRPDRDFELAAGGEEEERQKEMRKQRNRPVTGTCLDVCPTLTFGIKDLELGEGRNLVLSAELQVRTRA